MTEPVKLTSFVVPELGKQRIDAQWARIAERLPAPRRTGKVVPTAGVLLLLGALGLVWWPRDSQESGDSVWEGSVVSSDDSPVEMTLAEGTHIKVEPRSEVKLLHSSAGAVQVRLGHGSARFHVAKKPTRRFSVNLGQVEVVVTGTQFRVLRKAVPSGERVSVEVLEGSVEVRREGGSAVALRIGERWSTVIPSAPPTAKIIESGEPEVTTTVDEGEDEASDDERAEAEPSEAETSADSNEDDEASEEPATSSRGARRKRASGKSQAALELFDRANLARRAGRLQYAAELYEQVVTRHATDRRASLAAFELGRLRMDSLRDTRGAVHALERALKLAPGGAFAEDALARLVLAHEALHDNAACGRARTRYLSRYPEGVHAQHVAERCGGI